MIKPPPSEIQWLFPSELQWDCDAERVKIERCLDLHHQFRAKIKSERCLWGSESEWSSIYLYHSFYLSSFIGQVKMLWMKAFGVTEMIDHQQYGWTCFNLGGFLLLLCQSRYLTPCSLLIWRYMNITLLNFSLHF